MTKRHRLEDLGRASEILKTAIHDCECLLYCKNQKDYQYFHKICLGLPDSMPLYTLHRELVSLVESLSKIQKILNGQ